MEAAVKPRVTLRWHRVHPGLVQQLLRHLEREHVGEDELEPDAAAGEEGEDEAERRNDEAEDELAEREQPLGPPAVLGD